MPSDLQSAPPVDALVGAVLRRVSTDLEMMLGHDLSLGRARVQRMTSRPAGARRVHVSFRLGLSPDGVTWSQGTVLFPLPDAIAMACFLLMIPDDEVQGRRREGHPDESLKDAMMEIGNMLAGAVGAGLGEARLAGWKVRSEGCQGVRADVRPALDYTEGDELVVARVEARLGPFEPFELLLLLPAIG